MNLAPRMQKHDFPTFLAKRYSSVLVITGSDIDECLVVICENGGTCRHGINHYICECVAGYTCMNCETGSNFRLFAVHDYAASCVTAKNFNKKLKSCLVCNLIFNISIQNIDIRPI